MPTPIPTLTSVVALTLTPILAPTLAPALAPKIRNIMHKVLREHREIFVSVGNVVEALATSI